MRQHPRFFPLGAAVALRELNVPAAGHPEGISMGAFFERAVDAGVVDPNSTLCSSPAGSYGSYGLSRASRRMGSQQTGYR